MKCQRASFSGQGITSEISTLTRGKVGHTLDAQVG